MDIKPSDFDGPALPQYLRRPIVVGPVPSSPTYDHTPFSTHDPSREHSRTRRSNNRRAPTNNLHQSNPPLTNMGYTESHRVHRRCPVHNQQEDGDEQQSYHYHQSHPSFDVDIRVVKGPHAKKRSSARKSDRTKPVVVSTPAVPQGNDRRGASRQPSARTAKTEGPRSKSRNSPRLAGPSKLVLRYASDSKESGWLTREASRSTMGLRKAEPEKRMYFKLRGSTLTAHPYENYPEVWRSAVREVRCLDGNENRISLKLEKKDVDLRAETKEDYERWAYALNKAASTSFEQHYRKVQTIGKGHFSVVYAAVDRNTNEKFAVKVIKKDKRDIEKSKKFIRREVKILSTTRHQNVIRAVDFFSSGGKPHIVLEFVEGGSLRDMISKKKVFQEEHAKEIFRGIMEGVAYLHDHNIVHRDMKPENILMDRGDIPKITDFGLATFKHETKNIRSIVGTPSYVAPELIRNTPYGPPADIWSCGIILYFLLSGTRPFQGDTRDKMKKAVLEQELRFPNQEWAFVSKEARQLITRMLDKNQHTRITATQVLKHPWFHRMSRRL